MATTDEIELRPPNAMQTRATFPVKIVARLKFEAGDKSFVSIMNHRDVFRRRSGSSHSINNPNKPSSRRNIELR